MNIEARENLPIDSEQTIVFGVAGMFFEGAALNTNHTLAISCVFYDSSGIEKYLVGWESVVAAKSGGAFRVFVFTNEFMYLTDYFLQYNFEIMYFNVE